MGYAEILTGVLAFVAVVAIGGGVLALRASRRSAVRDRLMDRPQQAVKPPPLMRAVEAVGEAASGGRTSSTLMRSLIRAGIQSKDAPAIYMGAKVLLLVLGGFITLMLVWNAELQPLVKLLLTLVVAGTLSFVPNMWLSAMGARRRNEIRWHLADAVDLLEICVSAGMSMDMAWNAVADEIRRVSGVLADEMALANLEVHLGVQRPDAMRHMAERTGAAEISSLVAMLVQTERFGTSIGVALKTFAESIREQRSLLAQETAEKMAVKLIVPMVVLIFPAIVIVMAGPAAMELYKMLSQ